MSRYSLGPALMSLLAGLTLSPTHVSAQSVVLDEGRFDLFIAGREAGTESFVIHRMGTGSEASLLSTAEITLHRDGGTLEIHPRLSAGTDLAPQRYQNEISGSRTAQVNGLVQGGRFETRVTSPDGELRREYRFGPGTVLLEEDVAHLYYFLARVVENVGATVSVIVPSTGQQLRLVVASSELEPFRLGREQLEARHVRLEGGGETHEVWLDDQGRVLRVEIPAREYRAERVPG